MFLLRKSNSTKSIISSYMYVYFEVLRTLIIFENSFISNNHFYSDNRKNLILFRFQEQQNVFNKVKYGRRCNNNTSKALYYLIFSR